MSLISEVQFLQILQNLEKSIYNNFSLEAKIYGRLYNLSIWEAELLGILEDGKPWMEGTPVLCMVVSFTASVESFELFVTWLSTQLM